MKRLGSGFLGSSELVNSGSGEFEIVPNKKSFYKFEFITKEEQEIRVKINGGDPIVLWNGYFTIDHRDAKIHSFIIMDSDIEFYWYGAY